MQTKKINKMKKIISLIIIAIGGLFAACTEVETKDVSKVTYYPNIEVLGDEVMYIAKGATFTDPGAKAMAGDTEIKYTSEASGQYRGEKTLNTAVTDEYIITYSALNADGFKGSATRKVIVYENGNLTTDISGVYKCNVNRSGSSPITAQNIKFIYIWKNADGSYGLSDAFGGWYQYHRGFGIGYITPGGKIIANDIATNSFSFPSNPIVNTGFGGNVDITGVTVNAATKKIVITAKWYNPVHTFTSTLTQFDPLN
jgi:hypothetical protein